MLFSWLFSKNKTSLPKNYKALIDPEALKVVERLQRAGYETYLVGGCVRDILLSKKPKDFDISTNASPQKVKSLISRAFIIGKRFRIVVAKRPQPPLGKAHADSLCPELPFKRSEKEFQITTFRREPVMLDGKLNENVFGTAAEDAARRDFTINSLFLDPKSGKILDFLGGLNDLSEKKLRIIGDPQHRFREDPIRILRALRFTARANLKLEKATEQGLKAAIPQLTDAKRERVREEILKIFREGAADQVWKDFFHFGILDVLSKNLNQYFENNRRKHDFLTNCKALNQTPWLQSTQSPLFFLLLKDFFLESNTLNPEKLSIIADEFKIFKTEREEIERITATLSRIEKDPKSNEPHRLLGKNFRHYPSLSQTFWVLKILADSGDHRFQTIWKNWSPHWQDFAIKGQQNYESNFRGSPSSPHSNRTPRRRAPRAKATQHKSSGARSVSSPRGSSATAPRPVPPKTGGGSSTS
jgi:poly(A) polymerase